MWRDIESKQAAEAKNYISCAGQQVLPDVWCWRGWSHLLHRVPSIDYFSVHSSWGEQCWLHASLTSSNLPSKTCLCCQKLFNCNCLCALRLAHTGTVTCQTSHGCWHGTKKRWHGNMCSISILHCFFDWYPNRNKAFKQIHGCVWKTSLFIVTMWCHVKELPKQVIHLLWLRGLPAKRSDSQVCELRTVPCLNWVNTLHGDCGDCEWRSHHHQCQSHKLQLSLVALQGVRMIVEVFDFNNDSTMSLLCRM